MEAFWKTADDSDPERMLGQLRELLAELPAEDPIALFEWAGGHDFLGREEEAVLLYRRALEQGLDGDRRPQAVVQLASSLRNIGQAGEAAELLRGMEPDASVGAAREAFLALALHDAGKPTEALKVALGALHDSVPLYGGAVAAYARELREPTQPPA